MAPWIWPPVVFAAILCAAALVRGRRALALAFVAYGLATLALSLPSAPAFRFAAPLLVLVSGYWLTAPFYTGYSARLEGWLTRYDLVLQVDRRAAMLPAWMRGVVEAAYAGCYPFMIVAAIPAFRHSPEAFAWHWTVVLSAELACYVTLPWLQARPPREIETRDSPRFLRRFNEALLQRLSVHATTIPSGHVAGPVAASLAAWMLAPAWGPWLLAGAGLIAAATVIGRYHYAIDAALGLATGVIPPAVRWFWS
jgi:hypothetical protein